METIDQRREREELVGNMADIIQMAAELQKRAAKVMETIMLWNPPQEEQGEPPAPEPPKFVPLSPAPTPPVTDPMRGASVAVPAPGPVQITNAEPPPSTLLKGGKPKTVGSTRRNRILDGWERATIHTPESIARDLKMSLAEVKLILDRARETKDPRVIAGDALRKREPEIPATVEKNPEDEEVPLDPGLKAVVQHFTAQPHPTIMKARNGVSLPRVGMPKLDEDEDRKPPGWMPPLKGIPHDAILVVQPENRAVHGHKGYFRANKPTLDVMQRLSDGGLYSAKTLVSIGKYSTELDTLDRLKGLRPILMAIGVDLQINAGFVRLNRLADE